MASIYTQTEEGDFESLKNYLSKKGNPNSVSKDGWPLLMLACASGSFECVEILINAGADIQKKNKYKSSAIITASWNPESDMVKLLLTKGADPNASDEDGVTPLMQAMDSKNMESVRLLLDAGANPKVKAKDGRTLFHFAADKGFDKVIPALKNFEIDVNAREENNWDALYNAISSDNTTCVEALLKIGANVNAMYDSNYTPLISASSDGKSAICSLLIKYKADLNQFDEYGYSPLMRAALNGHLEAVKILVAAGADTSIKNSSGENVLVLAKREKQKPVVAYLEKTIPNSKSDSLKETKIKKEKKKKEVNYTSFAEFKKKYKGYQFPDEFELLCNLWDESAEIFPAEFEISLSNYDSAEAWFKEKKANYSKVIVFGVDGIHSLYCFLTEYKKGDSPILYLGGEGEGSGVIAKNMNEFISELGSGKEYDPFDQKWFDSEEDVSEEFLEFMKNNKIKPAKTPGTMQKKAKAEFKEITKWIESV